MSRVDTSIGIYNYPFTTSGTAETALLVPSATGVYPSLPSPRFPLSTSSTPVVFWQGVPPDIAGNEFDGHVFEVLVAAKVTTSATANLTVNLYNAKNSSFASGPGSAGYTISTALSSPGAGVTKIYTGTATAVGTGGVSVNFVTRVQFIWDSVSGILGIANPPTTYQGGSSTAITNTINATTGVASVGLTDINFFPSFTVSAGTASVVLTEFVINRI